MPNTCPVIPSAASLDRKATSGATFSGASWSNSPSAGAEMSPNVFSVIRVRAPGAMAFTRTPYRSSSMAVMYENAAMPALAAP
jgi:hypothetical protein